MSSKLQAGIAKISITPVPPAGTYLDGFIYREEPSKGVHDDLYSTVLILKAGKQTVVMVTLDIIGAPAYLVNDMRQRIKKATGIDGSNIMVAASHTHSAPVTGVLPGGVCGDINSAWIEMMKEKTVEGVQQAMGNMVDAKVGFGTGKLDGLTYNRHQVLKDGTVPMPQQKQEDIVRQGPSDTTVRVLRVDKADGSPLAVLTNFTCHPAILDYNNLLISGDYVGYLKQKMEKEIGGVAIFMNGACGNINPIGFNTTNDVKKQHEYARNLGEGVAAETARVAKQIKTSSDADITIASTTIKAPLCLLPTKQGLESLLVENTDKLEQIKQGKLEISPSNLKFSKIGQIRYQSQYVGYLKESLAKLSSPKMDEFKSVGLEIQVITINDIAFVGIPGEPYLEIALGIQKKLPSKRCVVSGYANGTVGYIPSKDAHNDGGYPVERAHRFYGQLGALAPEVEGMIIDTAVKLIEKSN